MVPPCLFAAPISWLLSSTALSKLGQRSSSCHRIESRPAGRLSH